MEEKSKVSKSQNPLSSNLKFYQRRYLVNSKLQYEILLYSVAVATVVSIGNQSFRLLLTDEARPILGIEPFVFLWIVNALMVFAISFFGYLFTNRIAGPMYRLNKHLEEIVRGGEIKEISVRKRDYFQDVMHSYNKLLIQMKNLKSGKS